jgi:hypothetical protein
MAGNRLGMENVMERWSLPRDGAVRDQMLVSLAWVAKYPA